ncbi:hypothetical protein CVT25_003731 [Psilocybe cyanescens]|uniref:Uncharacterized protein n=1 Tax=Psilocybe cyanescens TaxID=93625 RepID=A0A409XIU0_PSICY|nr:hypothetical protein CVT25_003731 [Psilocybe cyanescens]
MWANVGDVELHLDSMWNFMWSSTSSIWTSWPNSNGLQVEEGPRTLCIYIDNKAADKEDHDDKNADVDKDDHNHNHDDNGIDVDMDDRNNEVMNADDHNNKNAGKGKANSNNNITLRKLCVLKKEDVHGSTMILNPNLAGSTTLRLSWIWHSVSQRLLLQMCSKNANPGATLNSGDDEGDLSMEEETDPMTILEFMSKNNTIRPFNPFSLQNGMDDSWHRDVLRYIAYGDSRLRTALLKMTEAENWHQGWMQTCLLKESRFFLQYVSIAAAMGLAFDTPVILRSLAISLCQLSSSQLPLPIDSRLIAILATSTRSDQTNRTVSQYKYNWWNNNAASTKSSMPPCHSTANN